MQFVATIQGHETRSRRRHESRRGGGDDSVGMEFRDFVY